MTIAVSGSLRVSGTMLAGWAVSHRVMPANSGMVIATGQAVDLSLSAVYVLSAAQGAVTFAGQPAGLNRTGTRSLVAGQGAFALTGRPAILRRTRKMPVVRGLFTLTGQAATLTHTLAGAWPSAVNTGHTGTLTLSSGNLASASNGQTIQNLNVTGTITINHTGVTVENCQAQLILIGPSSGLPATNCIVQDCTIVGDGTLEKTGIVIVYSTGAMVRRNDISGVEEGVYVAFTGTVRDNWIHGPASPGDPVPEINGVTVQGGATSVLIEHNTIDFASSVQSTVFIKSDYGSISNVTVNNNKLLGGNYCVYSEVSAYPIAGVAFTNNRLDNWGTGPFRVVDNFVSWAGNVDDSASTTIPGPGTPATTTGVMTVSGQLATLTYSSAGPGGLPDATNTGVPDGTSLTYVGDMQTTSNGQVVDAVDADFLCIIHQNVTVQNSRFKVMRIGADLGNTPGYNASNATVVDSTLIGTLQNTGIWALQGNSNGATFLRCEITGVENGIWVEGNNITVQDCWFHDQGWTGTPHTDGLQIAPFSVNVLNMLIINNNFDLASSSASSCITISQGGAPGMDSSEIRNNRFAGGGYQIYFNGFSGPNIVDGNTFESWVFGPLNPGDAWNDQIYTNNIYNGVFYSVGHP